MFALFRQTYGLSNPRHGLHGSGQAKILSGQTGLHREESEVRAKRIYIYTGFGWVYLFLNDAALFVAQDTLVKLL